MGIRTLKPKLIHLPYLTLLAGLAVLGLAHTSHHLDVVTSGSTSASDTPQVTIDGQELKLGPADFVSVSTPHGTASISGGSVTVTSGGGRTVVNNPDGTVNVHVESKSSNGSSFSQTTISGGSFTEIQNDSSVQIFQEGEGHVSASN